MYPLDSKCVHDKQDDCLLSENVLYLHAIQMWQEHMSRKHTAAECQAQCKHSGK